VNTKCCAFFLFKRTSSLSRTYFNTIVTGQRVAEQETWWRPLEQEAGWRRRKTDLIKTTILWFWDLNLEWCKKKLEREAKHATVGIFGGKSGSADFRDRQGELPERYELRESCRGGPLRESWRGGPGWGSGWWKGEEAEDHGGFFYFFGDWAMARGSADHGRWA
jgi:hypothetical protein